MLLLVLQFHAYRSQALRRITSSCIAEGPSHRSPSLVKWNIRNTRPIDKLQMVLLACPSSFKFRSDRHGDNLELCLALWSCWSLELNLNHHRLQGGQYSDLQSWALFSAQLSACARRCAWFTPENSLKLDSDYLSSCIIQRTQPSKKLSNFSASA